MAKTRITRNIMFHLFIFFLIFQDGEFAFAGFLIEHPVFMFTGNSREYLPYTDIAIEKVEVDKTEFARGEKIKFYVTLKNYGEVDWTIIDLKAITNGKVISEKPVELGGWDTFDRMRTVLEWDTKGYLSGKYPVKIEAIYYYDANEGDNEIRLSKDIVLY